MTASEREALVGLSYLLDEAPRSVSTGNAVLTLTDRAATRLAIDLRALCAEVERLTRERDEYMAEGMQILRRFEAGTLHLLYCNGKHDVPLGDPHNICNCPVGITIKNLRTEVTRLTAEVERLREDAARLDYMDAQRNWTRWMGRDTGYGYTVWPVSGSDSFRAAIDAARTTGGRDA